MSLHHQHDLSLYNKSSSLAFSVSSYFLDVCIFSSKLLTQCPRSALSTSTYATLIIKLLLNYFLKFSIIRLPETLPNRSTNGSSNLGHLPQIVSTPSCIAKLFELSASLAFITSVLSSFISFIQIDPLRLKVL